METQTVASRGLSRANAELIVGTMERLGAKGRPVAPKELVDVSRPADSPTHAFFEWDDAIAGEAFRVQQAAALIREVEIVVQRDATDTPRRVRAFVNVSVDSGRGYVPTMNALAQGEMRTQLISTALAELQSFKRRYESLTELAHVFEAIDVTAARAA